MRHEVDKGCVFGQPLRQHYEQMEMISFMKPVIAYARAELNFDEALSWMENQFRQAPAQEPAAIAA